MDKQEQERTLAEELVEFAGSGSAESLRRALAGFKERVDEGHGPLAAMSAPKIYSRNIVGMGGRLGRVPAQSRVHHYAVEASPMTAAAAMGRLDNLAMLIDFSHRHGIMMGSMHGALAAACATGRSDCARLLLESGALTGHEDDQGRTPLHLAAMGGHAGCVAELIAAGAQADGLDEDGRSPLMLAMKRGFASCAEMLMSISNLDKIDHDENHLVHWAAEGGSAQCVAMALAARPELASKPDNIDTTPLMLAAAADSPACVSALLPLSDVKAENDNFKTALWFAARHGRSCVELLIPGSDLEARDDDMRESPLACAVVWDGKDAVTALLAAGANPMSRDAQGQTCLHAAAGVSASMVELLLPGSDPNARCSEGRTPLIHAVSSDAVHVNESRLEGVIRALMPVSDAAAQNNEGQTAAQVARARGNLGAASLIEGLDLAMRESEELGVATREGGAPSKAKVRV